MKPRLPTQVGGRGFLYSQGRSVALRIGRLFAITSESKNVAEICESVREFYQLMLCILVRFENAIVQIQIVLILLTLDNCVHLCYCIFVRHENVNVHCNSNKIVCFGGYSNHKVVAIEDGNVNIVEPPIGVSRSIITTGSIIEVGSRSVPSIELTCVMDLFT